MIKNQEMKQVIMRTLSNTEMRDAHQIVNMIGTFGQDRDSMVDRISTCLSQLWESGIDRSSVDPFVHSIVYRRKRSAEQRAKGRGLWAYGLGKETVIIPGRDPKNKRRRPSKATDDPQKDLVEEPHINGWQDVFDAIQRIKDEEKKLMVLLVQAKDELDRLLLQDQRIKELGITSLIEILEKKK